MTVAGWGRIGRNHVPRRWQELELEPLEVPKALNEWLTQLASEVVWAKAAGWQANEGAYTDLVTCHGQRMRHFALLPELLQSRELLAAIPDLADDKTLPETEFEFPEYAFGLDGAMAWCLWLGGAYTDRESWISPGRAKELSSAAVHAWFCWTTGRAESGSLASGAPIEHMTQR